LFLRSLFLHHRIRKRIPFVFAFCERIIKQSFPMFSFVLAFVAKNDKEKNRLMKQKMTKNSQKKRIRFFCDMEK